MVQTVPNSVENINLQIEELWNFKKKSRALEIRNAWVFISLKDKLLIKAQINFYCHL